MISLARMRRVLEDRPAQQRMTVEPGVTNADITRAVARTTSYFAPDPSSQTVLHDRRKHRRELRWRARMKYGVTPITCTP